MSKFNFQDMLEIIKNTNTDPEAFVESISKMLEFSEEIESCADNILRGKGNEYLVAFISIVTSFAMTKLMHNGMSPMQALLMAKDEDLMDYSLILVRMTLGLSVMEELR